MSDVSADGPPDEEEPGEMIHNELDAFAHHPKLEAERLRELAAEGESGATPFVLAGRLAVRLLLLVVLMIALIFAVYYLAR